MNLSELNKNISELRKEKGVTQEQLAKAIGVSAQAVSKWENGGVPDVSLLPMIADFFEVSLDYLFGRSSADYGNIYEAVSEAISAADDNNKMYKAMEICWAMEAALYSFNKEYLLNKTLSERIAAHKKTNGETPLYSSVQKDTGYTQMGLSPNSYFLLVPDVENGNFFASVEYNYNELFKDLSNCDFLKALIFLYKRNSKTIFTADYLSKKLNLDAEKTKEVIKLLGKYREISICTVELDDCVQECYESSLNPAFSSLLIFAGEMLKRPEYYYYYEPLRTKPFLK